MNRAEQLLAGLEHQREQAKKAIELKDKALRLAENRDFREIILENFCVTDCARFAQESGDPILTDQQRADALAMAQASGHLRRYLRVILQVAEQFENNMAELEEQIEAVRSGEVSFDEDDDENEGTVQ
jgi:hypothetical protein